MICQDHCQTIEFKYCPLTSSANYHILAAVVVTLTWTDSTPYFVLNYFKHDERLFFLRYSDVGNLVQKTGNVERFNFAHIEELYGNNGDSLVEGTSKFITIEERQFVVFPVMVEAFGVSHWWHAITDSFSVITHLWNWKQWDLTGLHWYWAILNRQQNDLPRLSLVQRPSIDPRRETEVGNGDGASSYSVRAVTQRQYAGFKQRVAEQLYVARFMHLLSPLVSVSIGVMLISVICYGIKGSSDSIEVGKLGFLPFLTTSIVTDSRSLQLACAGYSMPLDVESYKLKLRDASQQLIGSANQFSKQVHTGLFWSTKPFKDIQVIVHEMINQELFSSQIYLIEALRRLGDAAQKISEMETLTPDVPEFYFIYRNGPAEIIHALNQTVFSTLGTVIENSETMFLGIGVLQLLILLPGVLLVCSSLVVIFSLDPLHRHCCAALNHVPQSTIGLFYEQIALRLEILFSQKNTETLGNSKLNCQHSLWKQGSVGLVLIVILYALVYALIMFTFYQDIITILHSSPQFDFWCGLCRTMASYTFFWARETFLAFSEHGYYSLLAENSLIPSPMLATNEYADHYARAFDLSLEYSQATRDDDLGDLQDLLLGDSCSLMGEILPNCESTLIARGTGLALNYYVVRLKRAAHEYNGAVTDWEDVLTLEEESEALGLAFIEIIEGNSESQDLALSVLAIQLCCLIGAAVLLAIVGSCFIQRKFIFSLGNKINLKFKLVNLMRPNAAASLSRNTHSRL